MYNNKDIFVDMYLNVNTSDLFLDITEKNPQSKEEKVNYLV